MSLFSSFESGDIWASNGFAFASPINDMLEKESFTLTELLDEDEVLQEVKSLNPKLITFLSAPESVGQMVRFMTVPAAEDDTDNRKIKYPYMACEILCCEIPSILAALAGEAPAPALPPSTPGLAAALSGAASSHIVTDENIEPPERPMSPMPRSGDETAPGQSLLDKGGNSVRAEKAEAAAVEAGAGDEPSPVKADTPAREGAAGNDGTAAGTADGEVPILGELFAILDADAALDVRLAGYVEKVMAVLLKHKCATLVRHINAGGFELFRRFAAHVDDFSVTQMVRRLLLPKLASLQEVDAVAWQQVVEAMETATTDAEMEAATAWVSWGADERVLLELVSNFQATVGAGAGAVAGSDRHTHLSELLLSLICQCPADSVLLANLYGAKALAPLAAAVAAPAAAGVPVTGDDGCLAEDSRRAVTASAEAALRILDALVTRLAPPGAAAGVAAAPPGQAPQATAPPSQDSSSQQTAEENDPDAMASDEEGPTGEDASAVLDSVAGGVENSVPKVDASVLTSYVIEVIPALRACLERPPLGSLTVSAQTHTEVPRLGSWRLQVARFFESILRLNHPVIDSAVVSEGALIILLDLFAIHENCSLLHQAVANAVVLCLQDGQRAALQEHLLGPGCLLRRLLDANKANEAAQAGSSGGGRGGSTSGGAVAGGAAAADSNGVPLAPRPLQPHLRRLGYIGHAIMMSQAVIRAQAAPGSTHVADDAGGNGGSGEADSGGDRSEAAAAAVKAAGESSAAPAEQGGNSGATAAAAAAASDSGGSVVARLVAAAPCAAEWEEYTRGALARATELQSAPLGGFTIPSREDENQLSMDFPEDGLDMDAASMAEQMASLHMAGLDGGGDSGGGGVAFAFGGGYGGGGGGMDDGGWGQPGDDGGWANFQAFDQPDPSQGFQAFADFESAFASDGPPPQPPPRVPATVTAFADFAAFPEPMAAPPPPPGLPPSSLSTSAFAQGLAAAAATAAAAAAGQNNGPVAMEVDNPMLGGGESTGQVDTRALSADRQRPPPPGNPSAATDAAAAEEAGDGLDPMEG